jgi:hypothetical protein
MDTAYLHNGQNPILERYYEIPSSRKEEYRTPIKETSGLLYRGRSRPQGLSPWERNYNDDNW